MTNDRAESLKRVKKLFETQFKYIKREDIKSSDQLAAYEIISKDFKTIDLYMHNAILEFEDRLNMFLKLIDFVNLSSTARVCYERSCDDLYCVECSTYDELLQDIWPDKG